MSENNICAICGGYIGNAILYTTLTTTSMASVPPINFCPGHSTTTVGYFPIYGETGPEHLYVPQVSSIFPPDLAALWQIVQGVAEQDTAYCMEPDGRFFCLFCSGCEASTVDFSHDKDCIVTRARELMEWRNAQPRVEVKINYEPGLSRMVDEARRQIERSETEDGGFDGEVPCD